MSLSKIHIAFRLLFLLLFFRLQMVWSDFKSCLILCEKPGFLGTMEDHKFADKVLRRLLSWIPFQQACLLHSLSLASASQKKLEIHFSFLQKDPFLAHSFVKVENTIFSTSQHVYLGVLPIWSKKC